MTHCRCSCADSSEAAGNHWPNLDGRVCCQVGIAGYQRAVLNDQHFLPGQAKAGEQLNYRHRTVELQLASGITEKNLHAAKYAERADLFGCLDGFLYGLFVGLCRLLRDLLASKLGLVGHIQVFNDKLVAGL